MVRDETAIEREAKRSLGIDGAVLNMPVRSPNVGNANNARNVNTSGNVNNNNANNGNQAVVDSDVSSGLSMASKPMLAESESDVNDTTMLIRRRSAPPCLDNQEARPSVRERVCSFHALYLAAKSCRKNVSWKDSVAGYVNACLMSTFRLKTALDNGEYKISRYSVFEVHEPKTRIIMSTRFKDRVFQRSLCDNYLYDEMTKGFIHNNCACQNGKGTDFARDALKSLLRELGNPKGYVLKCDIKDYFGSTPHDVAKQAVRKRIQDDWAYHMVADIIDSFGGDKGIGLGSQISQLIQLAVLDDLDHEIQEAMGAKLYVRYMDDIVVLHDSKQFLKDCLEKIRECLSSLGLRISERKTKIQRASEPIKFLGFSFLLKETGRVTLKPLKESVKRARRRIKSLIHIVSPEKADECYQSWRAHASKGNSRSTIRRMDAYYRKLKEETP